MQICSPFLNLYETDSSKARLHLGLKSTIVICISVEKTSSKSCCGPKPAVYIDFRLWVHSNQIYWFESTAKRTSQRSIVQHLSTLQSHNAVFNGHNIPST